MARGRRVVEQDRESLFLPPMVQKVTMTASARPAPDLEKALASLESQLADLQRRQAPRRFSLCWKGRDLTGSLPPLGEEESLLVLEGPLGRLPYSAEGPALRLQMIRSLQQLRQQRGFVLDVGADGIVSLRAETRVPRPHAFDSFRAQLAVVLLDLDLRLGEFVALLHPPAGERDCA